MLIKTRNEEMDVVMNAHMVYSRAAKGAQKSIDKSSIIIKMSPRVTTYI